MRINKQETNKNYLFEKNILHTYSNLGNEDIVNKLDESKDNIKKIKDYSICCLSYPKLFSFSINGYLGISF